MKTQKTNTYRYESQNRCIPCIYRLCSGFLSNKVSKMGLYHKTCQTQVLIHQVLSLIIYLGRRFVSIYIFPVYSPTISKPRRLSPSTRQIMPVSRRFVIPVSAPPSIVSKLPRPTTHPVPMIRCIGFTLRLVIPSQSMEIVISHLSFASIRPASTAF